MHAPPWKFDARDCVWTREGRSRAGSWPRLFRGGDKKPDRTRTGLWIQRHYAREASAASSSAHTTSNGRLLGERQRDGRRERRHRARRCSVVSARKFQNSYLMILGFHMPPDFTSAIPRSFQGAPRDETRRSDSDRICPCDARRLESHAGAHTGLANQTAESSRPIRIPISSAFFGGLSKACSSKHTRVFKIRPIILQYSTLSANQNRARVSVWSNPPNTFIVYFRK